MIAGLTAATARWRPEQALRRLMTFLLFEGRPLTARGRWINPLVLAFLRASAAGRLPLAPARVDQPVFIVGVGRSGTTLTGRLLGLHPDVALLNEPKALWHTVHPGEDLVGSYTRHPARYRLSPEEATEPAKHRARRLYGTVMTLTRSRRVVDKYPEMIFRLPWTRELFPDARFVLLVRDGWSVCRSIALLSKKMRRRQAGEIHDWWGADDRKWRLLVEELAVEHPGLAPHAAHLLDAASPHDRAALEWALTMIEGARILQSLPEQVFPLRYEHLCFHPRETLTRLLDFCRLPSDPGLIARAPLLVHPPPPRAPVTLHPLIQPLFTRAMRRWNYPIEGVSRVSRIHAHHPSEAPDHWESCLTRQGIPE